MKIYDQFIPGKWQDDIDVNDFLSLNEKPFFKSAEFLTNSSENTIKLFQYFKEMVQNKNWKVNPDISFLSEEEKEIVDESFEIIPGIQSREAEIKIGFTESFEHITSFYNFSKRPSRKRNRKTSFELFEEVSTSEIKKMLKINLLQNVPSAWTPYYVYPDVRRVALYGTKRLIEDKRNYLKTLEKHLQTYEWIQKRILIHREIDSLKQLEQFCKKYNINISKPANNAKEAVTFTYLTILANVLENPSVPFTLTNVIPFLDVYIENDIASGLLKENQAQELIDQFYLKLCMIRFTYSPGLIKNKDGYMQMFGETFGPVVTKSTYRILQSVKKISVFPFTIRVIWEKTLPKAFKQEIEELLRLKLPIYIVNPRVLKGKKDIAILPNGGFGKTGEEMNFPAGSCDLEKVFYLAINGGKDVTTNTNLASITQPIKNKEIDYEETMGKFKDYLSYVLSSYVEMMNVVLHLNVSNNNHPLRNALMNNLNKYIIQFAFHNLEKIALLFSNIDKNTYEAKIDKNGWIENVIPMEKEAKDYEIIYAHILTFIETELRKIPIFNTGIASIRIHQRDPQFYFTNETIAQIWTLPPEFTNSTFHVSLKLGEETDYATFVEKMFNQDVHELNIFFDDEDKLLNGIIYKKSFKYQ